jgi:hypothetical protein
MARASRAIDQVLNRLSAAYDEAGFPPIRSAGRVDRTLATIRAEIAPLRLPAELERFWRLVDPVWITVGPFPNLTSADAALDGWRMGRDEFPGQIPKILFPVCYQSHGYMLVELEDGRGSGGVCLATDPGSPFTILFPTFLAYLDLLATMIELGEFTRHEQGNHKWTEFDPDRRWPDAQIVRLIAAQPLPGFGDAREIPADPRFWPEHWLAAEGLTPETRTPRGATSSVAELLTRASAGTTANGTIRGRVTSLASSGEGCRIAVDDGSGTLDLWCPTAVCIYGPVIRREFEFDVVVRTNPAPPADWGPEQREVQHRALSHDFDGLQAAAAELYAKTFQTPAAAEATAIRPVD